LMKLYVNPDGLAYSKEESLLNVWQVWINNYN
jgi:hypothetical protein